VAVHGRRSALIHDDIQTVEIQPRLGLVQLLIEAEADPTFIAPGYLSSKPPLTMALELYETCARGADHALYRVYSRLKNRGSHLVWLTLHRNWSE
jgi:hypothetical protein